MNRLAKKIHLVLVCLVLFSTLAWSACIIVPQNARTISGAMTLVKKGDTVIVNDGIYREQIYVNPGITLMAKTVLKSCIDGSGRGTVVTMGNSSAIIGFEVRNGTIGVFSTSAGVTISKCRIDFNEQTGIMCVGHLPKIEDNLIVYNKGSGIQGWDVQSTSNSVNHNTIALNSNHGISIGGNSSIIIENNIISNNDQFGVRSGDDRVRITMTSNNFFQNAKFTGLLPNDNLSTDPLFKNAQQLDFTLCKESHCIGRGSDSQDIGARITY